MRLENVKVGDKLRYLGGDPANEVELTRESIYDVVDIDGGDIIIDTVDNGTWAIGEAYKNVDCIELFEEGESESKSTLDLIANLAQEVAQLKRELSELRGDVQSRAYEDNERIDRILDDIVMLDERTQGGATIEPMPVRKVVYEYDRYYD